MISIELTAASHWGSINQRSRSQVTAPCSLSHRCQLINVRRLELIARIEASRGAIFINCGVFPHHSSSPSVSQLLHHSLCPSLSISRL